MARVVGRLPTSQEERHLRHLILQPSAPDGLVVDDNQLADVLSRCAQLESVTLSGAPLTSDRSLVGLARNAPRLYGLDLTNCSRITDSGVLELVSQSPPLQWLTLAGVVQLTDSSISAIAKTFTRLVELDLSDLPLLTPFGAREIWTHLRCVF